MKRITIYMLSVLLLLSSCAPNKKDEEIVQNKDEQAEQEISIVPSNKLSKENYKMILPFRPSEARGVIVNQVSNRLDINEMEEGLRRHSTEAFDPEKYYYEEGQYLTKDIVYELIENLNPEIKDETDKKEHEENPRYLSHILEQNFLQKKDDSVELVGVSIGVALKSVYRYVTEAGGPDHYEDISKKEMLKEGEKLAQTILERVREIEGLENTPIMIALYREEEQSSPVPGNFVAKTNVAGDSSSIGKWESINEEYILFPSETAKKKYFDDYELINSFGKDIAEYFPNYVGVIGEGFYNNEELKKLSIEIPIEFYGAAEVVGFTQYTYGVVMDMFPNYYDLEIKVTSSNKTESLIYREAGTEEPTVHILH